MNILQVVAPARVGGLERVVQTLAIGLVDSGHDVQVATIIGPGQSDHPFIPPLRAGGVDVLVLEIPPRHYGDERRSIAGAIKSFQSDVVHFHGARVDVVDSGVARRNGVPALSTAHGFAGGSLRNRFYEWLQLRALRRQDLVVPVTTPFGRDLVAAGVPAKRCQVVPNAWLPIAPPRERAEARQALGFDDDTFVLGWVGRVTHVKGLDSLIRVMSRVPDRRLVACVMGDGPELAAARALADRFGVSDRIRFKGEVQEASSWFNAFDAFYLSSRVEYCPIVLFEAMSSRVPIVANRVGGVVDVLAEDDAYLADIDDVDAAAKGLSRVMNDPADAQTRTGRAVRRLESEFSLAPWLARHEELYRMLIDE